MKECPSADAPFEVKPAYQRSIRTSRGVCATHAAGMPTVALSLPPSTTKSRLESRLGAPMFAPCPAVRMAGHASFEKYATTMRYGPVNSRLTGLATWAREIGELLARVARRRLSKHSNILAVTKAAASVSGNQL